MGSSTPPTTRYLLVCLAVLSSVSCLLRYSSYLVTLNQINSIQGQGDDDNYAISNNKPLGNTIGNSINSGTNFPVVHKFIRPKLSDFYVPWLALVGGQLHTLVHPWVFLTAGLTEQHLVSFIVAFATLFYGAKFCENIWGTKELLRFVAIVSALPNLILYITCFLVRPGYRNASDPYVINGSAALVTGLLVAFKQLVPEYMVSLFKGRIVFHVRSLPFVQLTLASCLAVFGYTSYFYLTWLGLLSAWIYLRFFRVTYGDPILPFNNSRTGGMPSTYEHFNESSGLKIIGDASDSFGIAEFFPEPLKFLVSKFTEVVTAAGEKLNIYKPFSASEIGAANARTRARISSLTGTKELISSYSNYGRNANPIHSMNPRSGSLANGSASIVTAARAEAERRRNLTMQALAVGQDELLQTPGTAVLPAAKAGKD